MLTVTDEYRRECLAIDVERRLQSDDMLAKLTGLFVLHGPHEHIRPDNGPEFTAKAVRKRLERVGIKTLFINPRSPWENGFNESFNGTLGHEVLKREIFYTLEEAQFIIEQWRKEYNQTGLHSSLGYRSTAPETVGPWMVPAGKGNPTGLTYEVVE